MRNDPVRVASLLGLPKQSFVVFGLCAGYATEKAAGEVKPRLPQGIVLHHERYDPGQKAALHQTYDAEMTKFSQRHELQAATWTQRVLNRLGPIKSMNGREKMRTALAASASRSADARLYPCGTSTWRTVATSCSRSKPSFISSKPMRLLIMRSTGSLPCW